MRRIYGFTLLELVLVILIVGILAAMSSKPLMEGLKSYTTAKQMATLDWQGNFALEHMSREIRSIPSAAAIGTATASQLSFTDSTNTSISYSVSSSNLVEGANTLSNNASSVVFAYYDRTGAVTAVLANIRFVKVTLTLNNGSYTYVYNTAIYLQNLP